MEIEEIKKRLAPCGLHCAKCYTFKEGDIALTSAKLEQLLGNFDVYAERFVDMLNGSVFKKYPDFKIMLQHFSNAECKGCRAENCKLFQDCKVRSCHESKGVDFCFQCPEFPCNNTGFDKHLYDRSVAINYRMKEIGVEGYYEEIKDKPRY